MVFFESLFQESHDPLRDFGLYVAAAGVPNRALCCHGHFCIKHAPDGTPLSLT
jgi:hypothetical protein